MRPEGYEFTEGNAYTRKSGKRECRTCVRRRDRARNKNGGRKDHYAQMYRNRRKRRDNVAEEVVLG